jgi:hypothetical protein
LFLIAMPARRRRSWVVGAENPSNERLRFGLDARFASSDI